MWDPVFRIVRVERGLAIAPLNAKWKFSDLAGSGEATLLFHSLPSQPSVDRWPKTNCSLSAETLLVPGSSRWDSFRVALLPCPPQRDHRVHVTPVLVPRTPWRGAVRQQWSLYSNGEEVWLDWAPGSWGQVVENLTQGDKRVRWGVLPICPQYMLLCPIKLHLRNKSSEITLLKISKQWL